MEIIDITEVRQILLMPLCFTVACLCAMIVLLWLEFKGKLTPPSLKSIRNNFDKAHPGLNRKFTIGLCIFFGIAYITIFHSFALDFIEGSYLVTSGTVDHIGHNRILTEERIYVNKKTYTVWFNNPKVELHKTYEIHYTPRTNIVVRVIEIQ